MEPVETVARWRMLDAMFCRQDGLEEQMRLAWEQGEKAAREDTHKWSALKALESCYGKEWMEWAAPLTEQEIYKKTPSWVRLRDTRHHQHTNDLRKESQARGISAADNVFFQPRDSSRWYAWENLGLLYGFLLVFSGAIIWRWFE